MARGIAGPTGKPVARLPADPTFEEIGQLGGIVEKSKEGHIVAGGTIYVSGEIPRVTDFEAGLPGAIRWVQPGTSGPGEWISEQVSKSKFGYALD